MNKHVLAVRNFIYEWSLNILILLFGTTTLVQAFIVPTPSMDSTVMVGDHMLVDKLAYAPAGSFHWLLPYAEPKRGDVIVFRYPVDIRANYVKRVIGVPGDRVHLMSGKVWVNGKQLTEPTLNTARCHGRASGIGIVTISRDSSLRMTNSCAIFQRCRKICGIACRRC